MALLIPILAAILIVFFTVISVFLGKCNYLFPTNSIVFMFILILLVYSLILIDYGYKIGQIDVLSKRKIDYELRENPDKTKEWVEINSK